MLNFLLLTWLSVLLESNLFSLFSEAPSASHQIIFPNQTISAVAHPAGSSSFRVIFRMCIPQMVSHFYIHENGSS